MTAPIDSRFINPAGASSVGGAEAAHKAERMETALLLALAQAQSRGQAGSSSPVDPTNRVSEGRDTRGAQAIQSALLGNPEALLGMLSSELRATRRETQENGAIVQRDRAEQAEEARQQAVEAAMKAAEESDGFLGLSGVWGDVAKVAAVAAAAAASVATCGGGAVVAVAIAGVALAAYSDEITGVMVDLGLPEDAAPYVSLALKITGSLMAGGGALAVAGSAAAGLAGPVADLLREAGVAEEVCVAVAAAMVVAGTVMGLCSGGGGGGGEEAAEATEVIDEIDQVLLVAADAARATETAARVSSGGAQIAAAEAQHRSDDAEIRGERQEAVSEDATEEMGAWIDEMKGTMKSWQRMIALVQQTAEARQETLLAASRGRG